MKNQFILSLSILFLSFGMLAQRPVSNLRKNRMDGLQKQRMEAKKNEEANKLTPAQDEELEMLVKYALDIMDYTEHEREGYQVAKMIFGAYPPTELVRLTSLYETYISEGKTSYTLDNYSEFITRRLPNFLQERATPFIHSRFNQVKTETQLASHPKATDDEKNVALIKWSHIELQTSYYLQILPGNSDLESIQAQALEKVERIDAYFAAKYEPYLKTSLHKKYRERVVISYNPIQYGSEKESDFLDEVTIDENNSGLYFQYYNNVPNSEYLKLPNGQKSEYVLGQLQLDDAVGAGMYTPCLFSYEKGYDLSNAEEAQAYLSLPVFPKPTDYESNKWLDPIYYGILQGLTNLELNTSHQAHLTFGFPGSEKEFTKKFLLTITDAGYKKLIETMGLIEASMLAEVKMSKPGGMHNASNISMVKKQAIANGYNVKRIVITGDSYRVFKNSNYPYEIRNKALNVELVHEEDGKCYLRSFQMIKDYEGGGNYGSPYAAFKWGTKYQILCENVAK